MPVSFSFRKLDRFQKRTQKIFKNSLFLSVLIFSIAGGYSTIKWLYQKNWSGFGVGALEPSITLSRDRSGAINSIAVEIPTSHKNLWDWLNLIVIPGALLLIGYKLQQQQHKRASNEIKEDALQTYFDNLSSLLIGENLLSLAKEVYSGEDVESKKSIDQQELLRAATDIMRARTLSVLRKFKDDSKLKESILLFLAESEIISRLGIDLSGADFSGIELLKVDLKEAKLRDANFAGATIYNCDFAGADLSGANFNGAKISFANLSRAKLGGVDFGNSRMSLVVFEGANFVRDEILIAGPRIGVEVNFMDAKLNYLNFGDLDLSGVDFSGASLKEANFEAANLRTAYFSNSNLKKANLSRANLRQVEFFRCKLQGANLSKACIDEASFTFANLNSTNLSDVDLSKTSLTRKQLGQAKFDNIVLPNQDPELQGDQDPGD